MAVSGVANTGSTSSLASSRTSIAENFDTFLQLLTTQLRNQNPLDPLDTNQFTSQLVQFTSVEQQLKTNEFLEALMLSNQSSATTNAVSFIGKSVTASGVKTELIEGKASWGFNLAGDAEAVSITIKDAEGKVVYTETGALAAGEGAFVWDGVGSDGQRYQSGSFGITIDARNSAGAYVPVTTQTSGKVTGVDLSGSEPVLLVGSARVSLSSVTAVSQGS